MQNLKTYESSIKCDSCGSFERYKSNNQCSPCKKSIERSRYAANKEKIKERNAAWSSKNTDKTREYKKSYKIKNPEKISLQQKIYAANNKEKINEWKRNWIKNNPDYNKNYFLKNKEAIREKSKIWRKKNSRKIVERAKIWRMENIQHARKEESRRMREWRKTNDGKAVTFMRWSLQRCLASREKGERTFVLLGYTHDELVAHLERQFNKWMSWDNYGEKWVIDHIIPVSAFLRAGVNDPKIVNALSNLRPLCRIENSIKSNKLELLL